MAATAFREPIDVQKSVFALIAEMTCASANVLEGAVLVVNPAVDDQVTLPSGADIFQGAIGLALYAGAADTVHNIKVVTSGIYPAIANGTITRGQQVTVASAIGDVKAIGITTAPGAQIIGTALESATNGQRVAIDIGNANASGVVEQFTVGSGGVVQGQPVVIDSTTNRQVVLAAGADQRSGVVGVALQTVLAGGTVTVVVDGPTLVTASGTITRGDMCSIASATAVKSLGASVMTGPGAQLIGYALDSCTNGQQFLMMVEPCDLAPNASIEVLTAGSGGTTVNTPVVMDVSANRQVIAGTVADQRNGVVGIALATVLAAAVVPVVTSGPATAIASGTITRGDILTIGAAGTVKSYNQTGATGALGTGINAQAIGYALDSATNAQTLMIYVCPFQIPNGIVLPFVAGTGGTTANCAVVQDTTTDFQVVLPAGADPVSGVLGIALNTATVGNVCFVQMHGVATIKDSGAGMTRGARVAIAGTNGQMKTAAIGAGTNDMILGTALQTISASGTGLAFINPVIYQG